jgi:hypothetical protein
MVSLKCQVTLSFNYKIPTIIRIIYAFCVSGLISYEKYEDIVQSMTKFTPSQHNAQAENSFARHTFCGGNDFKIRQKLQDKKKKAKPFPRRPF